MMGAAIASGDIEFLGSIFIELRFAAKQGRILLDYETNPLCTDNDTLIFNWNASVEFGHMYSAICVVCSGSGSLTNVSTVGYIVGMPLFQHINYLCNPDDYTFSIAHKTPTDKSSGWSPGSPCISVYKTYIMITGLGGVYINNDNGNVVCSEGGVSIDVFRARNKLISNYKVGS